MAKHMVKCSICGERFDANAIPFKKTASNRYAHEVCPNATQEQLDKVELFAYIKKVLNIQAISLKIQSQIDSYTMEYKYTYSGILKTLKYWYEVKKSDPAKANGGIGIVPYIYDQAKDYYYRIYLAHNANVNINIKDMLDYKNTEFHIPPPIAQRPNIHQMKF